MIPASDAEPSVDVTDKQAELLIDLSTNIGNKVNYQPSVMDMASDKAKELIALLDRYLSLRGDTLVSCPDNTAALAEAAQDVSPKLDDDIPVALQIYPVVPLSAHLDSLDDERVEMSGIRNRLRLLTADTDVVVVAKKVVGNWYAQLKEPIEQEAVFMANEIPAMLLQLRREQAKECESRIKTFSFQLVLGLHEDGKVSRLTMYVTSHLSHCLVAFAAVLTNAWCARHYHDPTTSWAEMQTVLTQLSMSVFARQRGHPNGYSLQDGKWLYQLMNTSYIAEGHPQDLATREDYAGMQGKMDSGRWSCLLIWHELIWKEAAAKKLALPKQGLVNDDEVKDGWRLATDQDFVGMIDFSTLR